LYAHRKHESPAFTGFSQVGRAEIPAKAAPSTAWYCPAATIGEIAAAAPALAIDSGVVKRTVSALLSFVALMLVAAPAAMADNGVGLAGPTTDKTVTFFCFGVMAFFVILVIVLSAIQGKLEKRKERRRYDLDRLS
jgi:hypothetical protein